MNKYMMFLYEDDTEVLEELLQILAKSYHLPMKYLPMAIRVQYALKNKYQVREKYKGWLETFGAQFFGGK
jgi:hypothetical protein